MRDLLSDFRLRKKGGAGFGAGSGRGLREFFLDFPFFLMHAKLLPFIGRVSVGRLEIYPVLLRAHEQLRNKSVAWIKTGV